jgi:hypothetical protein
MAYTTISKSSDYFNTKLYTGNSSTQNITGLNFQPDWVAIKDRDATNSFMTFDAVRGATKLLNWNTTNAESTQTPTLTSFNSDGFSIGNNTALNTNGNNLVAWNWKAGTSFTNDASSTGIGTIDSSGSASDTSGFSIVSYTGTGSAGTIKHGLSTAPVITLIKTRDGTTTNWNFLTYQIDGSCDELALNLNSEGKTDRSITAPTSSVFSVDTAADRNGDGVNAIAYCFSERKGFSKFGSYAGNGNADGTFIYTGFKPAWVMYRKTNSGDYWNIHDTTRDTGNISGRILGANANDAEVDTGRIDILSNGFKQRTDNGVNNGSGGSYLYMAFAEAPLVGSNNVPCTAR